MNSKSGRYVKSTIFVLLLLMGGTFLVMDTNTVTAAPGATYTDPSGNIWTYTGSTITAWAIGTGTYAVTIPSSNGVGQIFTSFGRIFNPTQSWTGFAITTCIIPSSITSISDYAFLNCQALTSVTIGNGVTSIGGDSAFAGCTALTSVSIPNSVTSIGSSAFRECTSLTSVTIPDSVTTIGHAAFSSCTALIRMQFAGNAPTCESGWTASGYANLFIFYLSGATGFTNPWNGRPTFAMNDFSSPWVNSVTATGASQVTLFWSAPLPNFNTPTGYKAYYGTISSPDVNVLCGSFGASTFSANITGLTPGILYYFGMRALNSTGLSPLSNTVSAIPYTVPDAPTLYPATNGGFKATLSWAAPSIDGGSPITGYKVFYWTGANPSTQFGGTLGAAIRTVDVTSLTPAVSYNFEVKAVNAAGDSAPSNTRSATPFNVPNPPVLSSANPGVSKVTLTWTAPSIDGGSPITGYKVFFRSAVDPTTQFGVTLGISTFTMDITGLVPGRSYDLSVKAVNVAGDSIMSNLLSATPYKLPDPPMLEAPASNAAMVSITWSAPSNTGYTSLTGYKVYYGLTSTPSTLFATVGASTLSADVTGITPGTLYYYAVKAVNAAGDSVFSNIMSFTLYTIPGTPTGLSATSGNTQVTLSWAAPVNTGGKVIDYYIIYQDSVDVAHRTGVSTSITGLTNGVQYAFTVAAYNAIGVGPKSTPSSATPSTTPVAPTGLVATSGNAQVSLSWTAPTSDGGATIDYYIVYRGGVDVAHPTVASATIMGLTNGVAYTFTVAAHNIKGIGASSSSANATPSTIPGTPTGLSATPSNTQVALSWTAPAINGGATIDYYIVYQDGVDVAHPTGLTITRTGLINGQAYSFMVAAHNIKGIGLQSSSVGSTPANVPGAPTDLQAVPGNALVALSWAAPTNAGGAAIDYYIVYRGGTDISHPTGLSTTISGLTNGMAYTFTVAAHSAVMGLGPQSSSVSATPSTTPGALSSLSATPGNAQVTLSWAAPSSDGGAAIDYYIVYQGGNDVAHPTNLAITFTGLTNGQLYSFTVAAHNSKGIGPLSSSASATPAATPTVPGAPTGINATPGDGRVTLSWTAPASIGGAVIDYYVIYQGGADVAHPTSVSTIITGLSNGASYSFTVAAHNSFGIGPQSSSISATPVASTTVPGAPSNLDATRSGSEILLSWIAPTSSGGSVIDYYVIYQDGTDIGHTTGLSVRVTGTIGSETYVFTVAAHNSYGIGSQSPPLTVAPSAGGDYEYVLITGGTEVEITKYVGAGGDVVIPSTIAGKPVTSIGRSAFEKCYALTSVVIPGSIKSIGSYAFNECTYLTSLRLMSGVTTIGLSAFDECDSLTSVTIPASVTTIDNSAFRGCGALKRFQFEGNAPTCGWHWNTDVFGYYNLGLSAYYLSGATGFTSPTPGHWEGIPAVMVMRSAPTVPQNFIISPGNAQATLSWTASASNGGAAIDYYIIYNNLGSDIAHSTSQSKTITGLTNGAVYTYTIAAHNSNGVGFQSLPVRVTPMAGIEAPGTPTGLSATPGNTQVSLSWNAPSEGSAAIDYYIVYQNGVDVAHPTDSSTIITGLTNGVTYTFTVVAHSSVGLGAMSSSASATPSSVPAPPPNNVSTDNTMLYAGIAIAIIAVIAVVVVVMRRKKK